MAILESATTAITSASNALTSVSNAVTSLGSATGLSSIIDPVTGLLSSVGSVFTTVPNLTLPLPNPLGEYATYNYMISIGVLRDDELNFPDTTYRAGKKLKLICKSANADPDNRINTAYGKFDFFVDNITIESVIGHEKGNNTNATAISFDILEPYSMGLFPISCQQAAAEAGHKNWRAAPFIMVIEFRGNRENGTMTNIPKTARHIPFRWQDLSMTVDHTGCKYTCRAMPFNQTALTSKHANLKHEVSVKGTTVQEVLQTGEKSLQAVLNQRLQQMSKDGVIPVPDEIVILFPEDISSESTGAGASSSTTSATTGTANTPSIAQKLGLSRSKINNTLVQESGQCNVLGKASMGYGADKVGDPSVGKDNAVYDKDKNVYVRANNSINIKEGELKFSQNTDIINAINQVLIHSDYPTNALDMNSITAEGYRKWWKVDVQVYNITSDENLKATGVKPQIVVYRVLPSNHHASSGPLPPNAKAPGFVNLRKQVVKEYNYIYTGKNTEVKKFDIHFNNSFSKMMSADAGQFSQDLLDFGSNTFFGNAISKLLMLGNEPDETLGVTPTQTTYTSTGSKTDRLGGGGRETAAIRAARTFHDQINSGVDMYMLDLTIMGDPYFIAQSGTGNYTSKPTQFVNLNIDGSVNYQNGEVDILVNFRSPIDINQVTGLYNFGTASASVPVMQYSGLFRVTQVTSHFTKGEFTQELKGVRRPQQESTKPATANIGFNLGNLVSSSIESITGAISGAISGATSAISDAITGLFK